MKEFESQPPSPKRVLGLLAPRTEEDGDMPVHVARGITLADEPMAVDEPAGDDPESIRARFFPNEPTSNPSLEWMKPSKTADEDSRVRFDLRGTPIPLNLSETLPSHLGLHHHAQGSKAGYTLQDLFLLSRSTVAAQRSSTLGVLAQVVRKLHRGELDGLDLGATRGQIREQALASAAASLAETGTVGVRVVDLLWETVVAWDETALSIVNVWLEEDGSPLPALVQPIALMQIKLHLVQAALPSESLAQLLDVLCRLARESVVACEAILSTDGLIEAVTRRFLPVTRSDEMRPNTQAIVLLQNLAASSREHAAAVVEPAETLLRYIVTFSQATPSTSTAFVTETIRLYSCLARFGMLASIAGLAAQHLAQLARVIREKLLSGDTHIVELARAYVQVTEAWIVCATDPHKTTPEHDFLWSQVVGLEWAKNILALRAAAQTENEGLHSDIWRALTAFLVGAKVNGLKGGDAEKAVVNDALEDGLRGGTEWRIVRDAFLGLESALTSLEGGPDVAFLRAAGQHASTLSAAVTLAVAASRPGSVERQIVHRLQTSEFDLTTLLVQITAHDIWSNSELQTQPRLYALLRPLSGLTFNLVQFARVAQKHSLADLVAATSVTLGIMLPGDEELAVSAVHDLLGSVTPQLLENIGYSNDSTNTALKAIQQIHPFFAHELHGRNAAVAPYNSTSSSISIATTLVLPSKYQSSRARAADWPLWPLNSLLKSGSSKVFANLPQGWDATETEVTSATLLLAHIVQRSFAQSRLFSQSCRWLKMRRAEAVFGCMRVFMLEHGQETGAPPANAADPSQEVFRDSVVDSLMRDLLRPFTLANAAASEPGDTLDLETVAARYLGPDTPFFQFYSDFVALYDAISFAHPLFGALLIPALTMRLPTHDYRRLVFCDHSSTTLPHLRVTAANVLSGDAMEFMWPLEVNTEVLGGMLGALVKGVASDFARAICVHHVASRIWPDLQLREDSAPGMSDADEMKRTQQARAEALLSATVTQGNHATVREVVLYGGCTSNGPLPLSETAKAQRRAWMQGLRDRTIGERLDGLLVTSETGS